MDYIKILIDGYDNVSDKNLYQRYKSEAIASINKGHTYDYFFSSCFSAIEKIKAEIEKKLESDKVILENKLIEAINNKNIDLEEDCYNQQNSLNLIDHKIDLSTISWTSCASSIRYEKFKHIILALENAKKSLIQEGLMDEDNEKVKNKLGNGIKTKHNQNTLTVIYSKLTYDKLNENKTVFIEARQQDFLSICSDRPLPKDFKRVKWVLLSRKNKSNQMPHKDAFFEFLEFLYSKVPNKNMQKTLFSDKNNEHFTTNKPNRSRYSNYYNELAEIFT